MLPWLILYLESGFADGKQWYFIKQSESPEKCHKAMPVEGGTIFESWFSSRQRIVACFSAFSAQAFVSDGNQEDFFQALYS